MGRIKKSETKWDNRTLNSRIVYTQYYGGEEDSWLRQSIHHVFLWCFGVIVVSVDESERDSILEKILFFCCCWYTFGVMYSVQPFIPPLSKVINQSKKWKNGRRSQTLCLYCNCCVFAALLPWIQFIFSLQLLWWKSIEKNFFFVLLWWKKSWRCPCGKSWDFQNVWNLCLKFKYLQISGKTQISNLGHQMENFPKLWIHPNRFFCHVLCLCLFLSYLKKMFFFFLSLQITIRTNSRSRCFVGDKIKL